METTTIHKESSFEVLVPVWNSEIHTINASDALHAAEEIAEEYNVATKNSLLKSAPIRLIVREKDALKFKVFEVSAEEIVQYQVDEIDGLFVT